MMNIPTFIKKQINRFRDSTLLEKIGIIGLLAISILIAIYIIVFVYKVILVVLSIFPLIIIGVIYISDYYKRRNEEQYTPPSFYDCAIFITTEDGSYRTLKPTMSAVDKHFSRTMSRFSSLACSGIRIDQTNGLILLRFNIIDLINPLPVNELRGAIVNDVIAEYNFIFGSEGIELNVNLEDYILVDIRKHYLIVAIAINDNGVKYINQRKVYLQKYANTLRNR